VLSSAFLIGTIKPAEASSTLQRYIPAEVPDGFTLHRLEDDQPAAEGYTMYFSSTTGWFSGTADLNAARTSVYILPNETDDQKYIDDYIASGGKPVTVHGNLGAMGVSGGYGSVRLITPTGFIVVNAFSPKMSPAYILQIANSLKADHRVNKPAYKMPTPKGTKTKFAGPLAGKYSKNWRYWMSKNAQEVVFYSSATTGIELEARLSSIGLPVHQVTVHGKPGIYMGTQVTWMETPTQQLLTSGTDDMSERVVLSFANSLKPVDEATWQAFRPGPPSPPPAPQPTLPAPSEQIASGQLGAEPWTIAKLEYNGMQCYLFAIGFNKFPVCPGSSGITWTGFPSANPPNTIIVIGTAIVGTSSVVLKDPQDAIELGRGTTISVAGEPFSFFVTTARMAIKPGSELMFGFDSDGKQNSGPVPLTSGHFF
jgi:hypothetical protein